MFSIIVIPALSPSLLDCASPRLAMRALFSVQRPRAWELVMS